MNIDQRSIRIACLLILCFSSLIQPLFGQQARSTVSGMVFDSKRTPITQIPVELLNDNNSVMQRTKTDGSGRYFFRALPSGRFYVRVLPLGTNFEEQTEEIQIAGIGADGRQLPDNVQADFQLRVRRRSGDLVEVTGSIFAQEVPDGARKLYEAAISDLDANRLETGVTALEGAIKIFPTYYVALTRLGLVYLGQQKYPNAKPLFTNAVAVNPRSFTAWYGLSYSTFALNEIPASIAAAEKALEIDKSSVNTLFLLGISQRRLQKYEEAEKALVQAKKLDRGKTPDINWNLALLYAHNLKRYKDAANELEAYLKIIPDAPNKDNVLKLIKQFRENQPPSD
jgi:tetratricopeptide (TPR) repeat protein